MLEVNVDPAVACIDQPWPAVPVNVNRPGWPVVWNSIVLPSGGSVPSDVRESFTASAAPRVPDGITRIVRTPVLAIRRSCQLRGALLRLYVETRLPSGP